MALGMAKPIDSVIYINRSALISSGKAVGSSGNRCRSRCSLKHDYLFQSSMLTCWGGYGKMMKITITQSRVLYSSWIANWCLDSLACGPE